MCISICDLLKGSFILPIAIRIFLLALGSCTSAKRTVLENKSDKYMNGIHSENKPPRKYEPGSGTFYVGVGVGVGGEGW